MSKEPLFPHVQRSREPLYPHRPRGGRERDGERHEERQAKDKIARDSFGKAYDELSPERQLGVDLAYLRDTEKLKHYWVEKNLPYDTWAIVEAFPGGKVRSPFDTKEEAIKREEQISEAYEWKAKLVPSPQEKFPKQHETLKKLYPYEFVEYHDDGDLTIQLLQETLPGSHKLKPTQLILVTTDGGECHR